MLGAGIQPDVVAYTTAIKVNLSSDTTLVIEELSCLGLVALSWTPIKMFMPCALGL